MNASSTQTDPAHRQDPWPAFSSDTENREQVSTSRPARTCNNWHKQCELLGSQNSCAAVKHVFKSCQQQLSNMVPHAVTSSCKAWCHMQSAAAVKYSATSLQQQLSYKRLQAVSHGVRSCDNLTCLPHVDCENMKSVNLYNRELYSTCAWPGQAVWQWPHGDI